jgi:hypothetical protein
MLKKDLRSDVAAEPKKIKKQGWLERQGGDGRTWKRCWFAVCPDCVEYFRCETLREIQGKIPIIDCTVSKEHPSIQPRPGLLLRDPGPAWRGEADCVSATRGK